MTVTPNDQERALIAMLHAFDANPAMEAPSDICIKIIDDPNARVKDDDKSYGKTWEVLLTLDGGFNVAGDGATFAAAWDDMVKSGDDQINRDQKRLKQLGETTNQVSTISDIIHYWLRGMPPHTPQEIELIMNLRRRAAKKDNYWIILEVNGEHPGTWEVTERKETFGTGTTFADAWDERF
jgi:hypothetical protein